MQIIKRVKIQYFRSIYATTLGDCSPLNIISGRNDCGKSNILRALNMFFNGQADWKVALQFYHDFSATRLDEVRQESVKGKQFISIEIEFYRPSSYSGSLPPTFIVKRRWFRDSLQFQETSSLENQEKANKLPSNLVTARRGLQTLLNRIHYEYVPAIKDRAYTQYLLGCLQRTLLESTVEDTTGIPKLASNLAKSIQKQVGDLQSEFKSATGLTTRVTPPRELSELFQAFSVATENGSAETIPLSSRGDGMQARYLSSVLNYIAEKSNKFFIWGFEEPENSLEYRHAEALALDFLNNYSKKSQIFLTTHSPAFVSLGGDDVACFRVFQEDNHTNVTRLDENETTGTHRTELNHEIGVLSIQKAVHDFYAERMADLEKVEEARKQAELELKSSQLSLLLVEGKTDKQIIDTAWKKLYNQAQPFRVRVADPAANGRTGGTGMLSKTIEGVHPDDGRCCVALFDSDAEGVNAFNQLSKNFSLVEGSDQLKAHSNGHSYALLLPAPEYRSDYIDAKNHMIEFMFEDSFLEKKVEDRGLTFKFETNLIVNGNKVIIQPDMFNGDIKSQFSQFRKIHTGKDHFANKIVPKLPKSAFESFSLLFEALGNIPNFRKE